MKLLDTFTEQREVRIFVPDITLQEAAKNQPFVMRIDLPPNYRFLEVVQIEDVLNGIMPLQGKTTTAYVFIVDPRDEDTHHYYFTTLMPDVKLPWTKDDGPIECYVMGLSTHSGVVVTHVETRVPGDLYDDFETEIQEFGYRLVRGKRYDKAQALAGLYKQHASKVADGQKVAQPVQPGGPSVAGEDSASSEPSAPGEASQEG